MRDLTSKWTEFNYNEIPHSLELFQVFYDYVKSRYQILDIGTGTGYTAIKLGLQGYHVIGIDINKKGIEKITRNTVHGNISNLINFQISTATNLPFKSESFDFIIMQAFLTTIIEKENRNKIIKECYRVLKKCQYLYLAVFGQTWHSELYRNRYLRDFPITKEEGSFLSFNKSSNKFEYIAHHYTEKELVFLLVNNGFKLDYFQHQELMTKSGNKINGFVIIAKK